MRSIYGKGIAFFCSILAALALSQPSFAQLLDNAPEPKIIATDDVGVDLRSGKVVSNMGSIAIGAVDTPGFSYGVMATSGYTDGTITDGIMYRNCTTYGGVPGCIYEGYSFNLNGDSDAYMLSPPSYTAPAGVTEQGALFLSASSGAPGSIRGSIIRKDGSLWEFGDGGLTIYNGNPYGLHGLVSKVTRPDGETLTYNYVSGELRSIVSSTGYMLHLQGNKSPYYISGNVTIMQPGRPDKVVLINLAVDYCDPFAVSCSGLTVNWPSMSYTGWSTNTITATDSIGRTRQRSKTGTDQFKMTQPSGAWFEFALEAWQDFIPTVSGTMLCDPRSYTKWFKTVDGQWDYNFVKTSACRGGRSVVSGVSTAPDGVTQSWNGGFIDGLGRKTVYTMDGYNNFFGSGEKEVTSITQPENNKFEFGHDGRNNTTSRKLTSKDASSYIEATAEYVATCTVATSKYCNKPNFTIDAKGNRTDYTYSADHGGVLTKTAPAGTNGIRPQTRYAYQQFSASFKNASGQIVTGTPIWKLVSESTCITLASCTGTANEVVTEYTYNGNLLPVTTTIKTGTGTVLSTVAKAYDVVGNVTSVDGPAAGTADTVYYFYDAARQLIGQIDPDPDGSGALPRPAKRLTYDLDGRLSKEDTGTATGTALADLNAISVFRSVEYSFDARGRKIAQLTKGSGSTLAVTNFSYDIRSRLDCTAVRMNPAVFGSLPSSACTLGTQGSNGPDRIIRNVYDAAGQLTQVRKGVGTTSPNLEQANATYSYTPNGKREYVIDARGNRARFVYDGFDRQSHWYFPSKTGPTAFNGATQATALSTAGADSTTDYEQYGYDANGNRTGLRKRDARFICNQFDALNRASVKFYLATTGSLATCQSATSYGTDAVFYGHDLRGLQIFARFGATIPSSAYASSCPGTGNTYSNAIISCYDNVGRLITSLSTMPGTGASSRQMAYQYDANGNRTRLTYPDSAYVTYDYDGLDRMTVVKENGSTTVGTFAYNNRGERDCWYASAGSNCSVAATNETDYGYDPISRFVSVTHDLNGTAQDVTYCMGTMSGSTCTPGYNAASQVMARTISNDAYAVRGQYNANRGYTTNGLNQYTVAGATSPTYDANGNLTFTDGATYGYDIENRLTSATGPVAATLTYDPLGRLSTTAISGTTTRFLYDGDELVGEYNSAGTLQRRYVHGPNTDEPIFWYEGATLTDRRVLRADHQGSIVSIADASGNSLGINSYDEWGNPGPANSGRFAYTGQIALPELKLYHYKARVYSPKLGRFLQTDPVGYNDQINLYAYVANDPLNGRDPTGKECISASGTTTCATGTYNVSFPTQPGWRDFNSKSENYHLYSVPAHTSQGVDATRQWVQNNPTPGSPQPATAQGTANDATPGVGGISPVSISPVTSFATTNAVSGNPVVVNVTMPGHPLQSGIVVREVTSDGRGGSVINNWGEGTAALQSPDTAAGRALGPSINNVWSGQVPPQQLPVNPGNLNCGPMRAAGC